MTWEPRRGSDRSPALVGTILWIIFCVSIHAGTGRAEDSPWTTSKQELVDRVNKERADHDLKTLVRRKELDAAAQGHAENMADQNKMIHELDDKNPADRAKTAG